MAPPTTHKSRLRLLWWLLAAVMLAVIFLKVPLAGVLAAAEHGRIGRFLAVAITFTLATFLLDATVHFWFFRRFLPPVSAGAVFRARGESYLLLALGAIYGQGGMAWFISRRAHKPLADAAGVLLFLMFNTIIAVMIFPTLALLFVAPNLDFRASGEWHHMPYWLGASWAACAAIIIFWARDWKLPLREHLKHGLGSTLDRARPRDYAAATGLRALQVLSWCCFTWLGVRAFNLEIPLSSLLLFGPLIGLAAIIPTPGRLGTSQGAWLLLFNHYDSASVLAFSLCWTVGVSLCRWLLGAAFVATAGREERSTAEAQSRGEENK